VGAKKAPNFKTWEQITQELGHTQRTLEIFKVDIEGHEPGVIAELRHNLPLPRQIVMEIHMRPVAGTMIQRPAPRTPAQLALLMLHLASLGYGIVGQEDNIWGEGAQTGQGCCAEWTFLHVEQPWVGPGARGIATSRHKRQGLGALGLRGGRHFLVQQRAAAQMHDEQQLAEAEHKQQEQQQQQSAGDPEEVPLLLEAAEVQLQQQNQLAELLLQEPQQAAASDLPAVSTP
jgi:hypothetical protein